MKETITKYYCDICNKDLSEDRINHAKERMTGYVKYQFRVKRFSDDGQFCSSILEGNFSELCNDCSESFLDWLRTAQGED